MHSTQTRDMEAGTTLGRHLYQWAAGDVNTKRSIGRMFAHQKETVGVRVQGAGGHGPNKPTGAAWRGPHVGSVTKAISLSVAIHIPYTNSRSLHTYKNRLGICLIAALKVAMI